MFAWGQLLLICFGMPLLLILSETCLGGRSAPKPPSHLANMAILIRGVGLSLSFIATRCERKVLWWLRGPCQRYGLFLSKFAQGLVFPELFLRLLPLMKRFRNLLVGGWVCWSIRNQEMWILIQPHYSQTLSSTEVPWGDVGLWMVYHSSCIRISTHEKMIRSFDWGVVTIQSFCTSAPAKLLLKQSKLRLAS